MVNLFPWPYWTKVINNLKTSGAYIDLHFSAPNINLDVYDFTKFTWKSLYMQAFGPPEKATKTTGHGLILSSCTPKSNKDCASVKCIPNLMRWSFLIISINYRSCLTSYFEVDMGFDSTQFVFTKIIWQSTPIMSSVSD